MSRAFTKEPDGGEVYEDIPDRPISPHANLVTTEGRAIIDETLTRLRHDLAMAQAANDRAALARSSRDLRYWTSRRATAQVVTPPEKAKEVSFGTTVTIERDDGRRQTYRIVGEDEADPTRGTLSYISPVAQALKGKVKGDVVRAGNSDAEIIEIV